MKLSPSHQRPRSPVLTMTKSIVRNGEAAGIVINGDGSRQDIFTEYPGSKGGAGVWQTIINQIPPHEVWIEAFAGGGHVTRRKKPASVSNIVVDSDPEIISAWQGTPGLRLICDDALSWLAKYPWTGREVLYCDPPYLRSVRSCKRDYYRHTFATAKEHAKLLKILKSLPCRVILSGYPSALYARLLEGWRVVRFQTVNRRGKRVTEWLWLNYPEPFALHDYLFLGRNFRERERIKRKKTRWLGKLSRMGMLERAAILDAVSVLTTKNDDALSRLIFPRQKRRASSELTP